MPAHINRRHFKFDTAMSIPKPFRQGNLDCLCGLYSIVNACRQALKSSSTKKHLGSWQLFTVLVEGLEGRGKLTEVMGNGIGTKDHNHLLAQTRHYLLNKHGLVLTVKRPLITFEKPKMANIFKILQQHLETQGTAALLEFETSYYSHWTAITKVDNARVYFADSCGMKSRPFSDFQIKARKQSKFRKKVGFPKSGLILLQVIKKD